MLFPGIRLCLICILTAAISLTLAPAASALNDAPDAMPTGTETLLYSFGVGPSAGKCKINDGADPKGSLTYVPATGLLFGRTSTTTSAGNGDGTIFQIMPDGTGYVVDHFFTGAKTDGSNPRHNAMTLVGTVLYGTTFTGGKHNNGTIFSITDDGTYSMSPVFDFAKTAKNNGGDQPHSCFVAAGSVLYGMTSQGGKHGGSTGDGTIFSFDTSSNTYTGLYSFDGKHGADPHGQLILDPNGSTFYGMTRSGGKHDVGVVFSFDISKNKYNVLHNFSCPGNSTPMCIDANDGATSDHGTLVQNNSTLYGLTTYGGKYGNGTLFSIHTDGKHFTILQQFGKPSTNDGINPYGSLLLNGTTLFGTTRLGGSKGNGTVFQIDTDGTNYDRIYDFQGGNDAANPIDNVILLDNTLYGMTEAGGLCGNGAIFALVPP
ncbi:MAG TPA: choice-of-anchor tandem repeat GloVer-containing protein [Candidatus Binatus sp.]|uniref:choice-of-anchor tandem repeat GloVer-containing protein n=1 Tax=Candidatus Binatus sp. TaxID=2811406 RepID=UPI002B47E1A8|nr:choice-of-anchor tandem repeat GloVer-containing protein [Candidatus Binatus sp.]HKN12504.1 choice-of-anchor tandem repeat GloVer-containing protein [Candidatus Binatus sp.]